MKTIVTGGCGFIGSNLVERLVNEGHKVLVIDNLSTGNLKNIESLDVIFSRLPYCKINYIINQNKFEPDIIFHLGMPSNSLMYKSNPLLVSFVVEDWVYILEYAKGHPCKIVYASTSSMYNGNPIPWQENMPIHVFDFYTESRYYIERFSKLYYDLYDVKTVGLRMFSVYGTKERFKGHYANMLSQFLWCYQKNELPLIYGDGTQSRDTIYINDVIDAYLLVAKSDIENDIFNVGTGKTYSFNYMLHLLSRALNKVISPTYIDNPIKNYIRYTCADTSKAEKILGFKAKVSIEEGIKRVLEEEKT